MDSFYDQPRSLPKPTLVEKVAVNPTVPEVSMIFQNKPLDFNRQSTNANKDYESYNSWKYRNQEPIHSLDPMSAQVFADMPSPSQFRKQVRFESPTSQNGRAPPNTTNTVTYERSNKIDENKPPNSGFSTNAFENIYMANVPNMNLDLSIIDQNKQLNASKTIKLPKKNTLLEQQPNKQDFKSYKEQYFKSLEISNKPTNGHTNLMSPKMSYDLYNYKRRNHNDVKDYSKVPSSYPPQNTRVDLNNVNCTDMSLIQKETISKQNECRCCSSSCSKDNEPTAKDLLKIIQQQNEQILILQKQVSDLIESRNNMAVMNYPNQCEINNRNNHLFNQKVDKNVQTKVIPKFAIDVMTSFEVSIRPQQSYTKKFDNELQGAKIQEISENEVSLYQPNMKERNEERNSCDDSLVLNEPIQVREDCPSPDHSIHVNMQDYSSDSDEETPEQNIGWTIYNNVMGQVNNILKNAQVRNKNCEDNQKIFDHTLKKAKEATLNHLKSIGVNLPSPNDSQVYTDESSEDTSLHCSPTEISFAVKQLLMKYLPDEQLAKITYKPDDKAKYPVAENTKRPVIKGRPEFSFATVQYLRKYNLLSTGEGGVAQNTEKHKKPPLPQGQKLLDITALKQQPKLL